MMRAVRLVAINIVIFLSLIAFAEIGLRSVWTVMSCMGEGCNFSRITKVKFQDFSDRLETKFLGITRVDPELGYAPNPGFDDVISAQGWDGARVTIDAHGFRVTNADTPVRAPDILVVGDSFTFGDQVSNEETWAACLERSLDRAVDNGGVFGYGAAQAFKRASVELQKRPYRALVVSILVGGDLERDRMDYRIGFPRPAVIHSENGIDYARVSDPNTPGTRYAPTEPRQLFVLLYENSLFGSALMDRVLSIKNVTGDRLQTEHPEAASIEDIASFIMRSFAQTDVEEKDLLMQYREDLNRGGVVAEREMIHRIAASHPGIRVVDTYDTLMEFEPAEVWNEHHNPHGNKIVCRQLGREGF